MQTEKPVNVTPTKSTKHVPFVYSQTHLFIKRSSNVKQEKKKSYKNKPLVVLYDYAASEYFKEK